MNQITQKSSTRPAPPDPTPRGSLPVRTESIEWLQPVRVPHRRTFRRVRWGTSCSCSGCWIALLPVIFVAFALLAAYFLSPLRTSFLVLGIDRVPQGTALGRSDTIILVSVNPLKPQVALLSIPRDLWVDIPGVGENRINTAHFFAEAQQPGSGPEAALEAINQNFGLRVNYFVRLRFDAFQRIVDALGGVTLFLPEEMGGLPAGEHHLDGAQALAFVRDRKGSDDFFRMAHGQLMVRSLALQVLSPVSWLRLPAVAGAVLDAVDTNLPIWLWPRLSLALARASLSGFDGHTIQREMVTPYITDGGADVLLPRWELIRPMVQELFGQ